MTKSKINSNLYAQWILLKPTLYSYSLMIFSYWILAFFGLFSQEIAIAMGQLVIMLSPLALFSREEACGFPPISALFPQGREGFVTARYLFALALTAVSTLITLLCLLAWQYFTQQSTFSWLLSLLLSTFLGLIFLEISLPILFHLGAKEGKPWFFLLVLTPVALFVMVLPQLDSFLQETVFNQNSVHILAWLALWIGFSFLGFLPSYGKSLKIYENKSIDF